MGLQAHYEQLSVILEGLSSAFWPQTARSPNRSGKAKRMPGRETANCQTPLLGARNVWNPSAGP